jgi:hypothetical protein
VNGLPKVRSEIDSFVDKIYHDHALKIEDFINKLGKLIDQVTVDKFQDREKWQQQTVGQIGRFIRRWNPNRKKRIEGLCTLCVRDVQPMVERGELSAESLERNIRNNLDWMRNREWQADRLLYYHTCKKFLEKKSSLEEFFRSSRLCIRKRKRKRKRKEKKRPGGGQRRIKQSGRTSDGFGAFKTDCASAPVVLVLTEHKVDGSLTGLAAGAEANTACSRQTIIKMLPVIGTSRVDLLPPLWVWVDL